MLPAQQAGGSHYHVDVTSMLCRRFPHSLWGRWHGNHERRPVRCPEEGASIPTGEREGPLHAHSSCL